MSGYSSWNIAVGQTAGVMTVPVTICRDCGTAVQNTTQHDKWHEDQLSYSDLLEVLRALKE
ncbi:hypothetical protein Toil_gp34 [Rhodococcus phage Toil]|uniref:Uncharacterized protein n=1 Tax=Rhodococcus phage Toil TaxID=1975614 RepID=A0A1W6DXI9_9VIRU|nr:hypothetical protein KMD62_gp34 [Rhodococcus phage Toil]ARK07717.1 hypothetical protein Toil_gp34 [Rhodococcus phage Toil]